MDLNAFHALVATIYPQLHISVGMSRQTTALATIDRYNIKATGAKMPEDVSVTADTPTAALALLKPAIAAVRRRHETEKVLAHLQGEWSEIERHGIRKQLTEARDREGFDRVVRLLQREDAQRAATPERDSQAA